MLRRLLAERFGLKVRVESRLTPVYDLVRADTPGRPAPQLRSADGCGPDVRQTIVGGGGRMILACTGIPMLAGILSEAVGRPVIDQTGLSGRYNGTLEYDGMEEDITGPGRQRGVEPIPPPPAASIFTAVQEQLGLKLVSERRQLEYLVIAEVRRPSLN